MKLILIYLTLFFSIKLFSFNVTFRLNMNGLSGFINPEVNGSFNNWCGNCNPMTDSNNDGIWETTINLNSGLYEYKFSFDNWAGQENITAAGNCAVIAGNYNNRFINVQSNQVLNIVCWGLCSDCLTNDNNNWALVWSDEFNGTSLNQQFWSYNIGSGGWGNNELQYYTNNSNNIQVNNGSLKIIARNENINGSNYSSGRIITNNLMEFKYGKIEARIKIPNGQGIWPAFWMLGANFETVSWPQCGEIDIMEHVNNENLSNSTVHWKYNSNHSSKGSSIPFDKNQFHDFGAIWSSNSIIFTLDGHAFYEFPFSTNNTAAIFQQPFFLLLNVAVGGNWPGNPNGTTIFPATMEVDYIRIYNLQTNSLSQNSQQSPTHIFPMPCDEEFNIENLPTDANWKLNVFNSMGQLIKQQDLSNSFNTIQTLNWDSGIYFLSLTSNKKERLNYKIIKN